MPEVAGRLGEDLLVAPVPRNLGQKKPNDLLLNVPPCLRNIIVDHLAEEVEKWHLLSICHFIGRISIERPLL